MKPLLKFEVERITIYFSALGRAVWDETAVSLHFLLIHIRFQCSRSSRMG